MGNDQSSDESDNSERFDSGPERSESETEWSDGSQRSEQKVQEVRFYVVVFLFFFQTDFVDLIELSNFEVWCRFATLFVCVRCFWWEASGFYLCPVSFRFLVPWKIFQKGKLSFFPCHRSFSIGNTLLQQWSF